ncbi:PDDEXK nuclease domain-containing protein [Nocardioides speluncae]|uniref:PDDEXK nuclease domain-containing protein n=1 Tax=Nocardioides speluncae TaxID=2670337 RepID=UPI000D69A6DC|nr:PDDEXK nuclease domain-containing protein [Nocardioides speluncae]
MAERTGVSTGSTDLTGFPAAPAKAAMPEWYPELLETVSQHVVTGHRRAVRAANTELLASYWRIGKEILDRQQAEGWGTKVIDRQSADLKRRLPDARGFSPRNLKYMRAFAAAWPDREIVQRSAAQLPWRHHQVLLDKLDDAELRAWYAAAASDAGWSRDVLVLQIEGRLHERSGKAVSNFGETLPVEDSDLAQQATRDPYLFDFLSTAGTRHERDIENGLIQHLERFLLELGQGFAFVGRQVRLELAGDEFYCDLLFYHLKLRCYVVIELKAGPFKPEFLGQLGMYRAAVDDLLAHEADKPTIGLLLCKSKNNVVAEYALRGYAVPIGVAEWQTQITKNLPEELASSLPSVEQLEAELAADVWEDES